VAAAIPDTRLVPLWCHGNVCYESLLSSELAGDEVADCLAAASALLVVIFANRVRGFALYTLLAPGRRYAPHLPFLPFDVTILESRKLCCSRRHDVIGGRDVGLLVPRQRTNCVSVMNLSVTITAAKRG
jgi:hypothetical protein